MTWERERSKILDDLEHGRISAEEGLRLLQALEAVRPSEGGKLEPGWVVPVREEPDGDRAGPQFGNKTGYSSLPLPSDMQRWQSLWRVPFWVGLALTLLGALLLYQALRSPGFGLLFFLAAFPFVMGVVFMALGWWARTARWLHLRIRQKPGRSPENLAISFPLPLGLAARFLQRWAGRLPPVQGKPVSEVLLSLQKDATPEKPFHFEANDDRTGESVRIYIS